MILHHEFIKSAKKQGEKMDIVDRTTNRKVSYSNHCGSNGKN